jgi:hypothetical protein
VLRWVAGVVAGVVIAFVVSVAFQALVGNATSSVGTVLVFVAGWLTTGTVAGARTPRQWVLAGVLWFVALIALALAAYAYVSSTEG